MAIPSFFKQNRPKGYNYTPRYYNPEREAREERIRNIKAEMGIEGEDKPYKPGISRGSMSTYFQRRNEKVRTVYRHQTYCNYPHPGSYYPPLLPLTGIINV